MGMQAAGSISAYKSEKASIQAASSGAAQAYRSNARIAERNAQLAMADAMAARLSTLRRVEDIEMLGRLRRGSMTAATASRGVVANTGSPLEALAADAYETGKYAAEEHLTGMTQARSLEIEAINQRFQASYDRKLAAYTEKSEAYQKRQAIQGAKFNLINNLTRGGIGLMQGFQQSASLLSVARPASTPAGAGMVSLWVPPSYNRIPFQMPPGE